MKFAITILVGVLFASSLAGCSAGKDVASPAVRLPGRSLPSYSSPATADRSLVSLPETLPGGPLTLEQALAEAIRRNAQLKANGWEIRAREATVRQAGLLLNPELSFEIEEFAGTGSLSGFQESEIKGGISQRIELGGDRHARRSVASRERDLAAWDYEAVLLDLSNRTTKAFFSLLAAQERVRLADSLLVLAAEFARTVQERSDAGKVSPLEAMRAGVARSTAGIEQVQAARELNAARTRLAAQWSDTSPTFDHVEGPFEEVLPVPSFEAVVAVIERNPDVARWATEMDLRRADLRLARAQRVPDPVLTAGPSWFRHSGEAALTAGVSVPLPLFDRNQGDIESARARIEQGEALRQAVFVEEQSLLAATYNRLAAIFNEVTTLRRNILPAARENFEATREGYREGKFDLITVLDAQRTLFEATNQYVDALETYHASRADIERLIGTPIDAIPGP